eukprot:TRINITY_DN5993_c0_g2_i1.p1 TRINITY_DN5993_c0_g2~~TRINITY_DN5993_c0_g2_i1.p1  ORF type:complete len:132 (-),score=20.71 TRINITY_DN5993_c0_g2_i1:97-492(-)
MCIRDRINAETNKTEANKVEPKKKFELDAIKVPYIDYKEFVKHLFVFSSKAPTDQKLQFYFRMFDANGDQGIDEKDLEVILDTLGKDNKLTTEQKGNIMHNIMSEGSQGKGYIDLTGNYCFASTVRFSKDV